MAPGYSGSWRRREARQNDLGGRETAPKQVVVVALAPVMTLKCPGAEIGNLQPSVAGAGRMGDCTGDARQRRVALPPKCLLHAPAGDLVVYPVIGDHDSIGLVVGA